MAKRKRGRYEGSLWQRKSGNWCAQTTPSSGARATRTFKTKIEAVTWLREMQGELDRGYDYAGSKTLLKDYLHDWLNTTNKSLRPKTFDSYRRTVEKHIIPYLGEIPLKDIKPHHVEKFYTDLLNNGVGVRTVRLVHSVLHRALGRAVFQLLLTRNPSDNATLPQSQQGEMMVLDEIQVNTFLVAASDSPYLALYHLAVKTGMRQGELLGLKWSDLQWGPGRLYIQRQLQDLRGVGSYFQEPKTRAGRRTLQLGEGTMQALREHYQYQQLQRAFAGDRWQDLDLIFPSSIGTPLNSSNLRLDFIRYLDKAGLPRVRFHDLRHTAASLMLNNGIPVIVVSRMLGHSKPSITLDVYGHLYNEMQGEAVRLMDELVSPVKVNLTLESTRQRHQAKN